MPGAVGPDERDAVAAVQRQVGAREDAVDGDVAQRGDEPAAVAVGLEADLERGRVARLAQPLLGGHLALEPVLAHLGLLRHLGREPLDVRLGRAHAVGLALGVLALAAGHGDVGLQPPAALVLRLDRQREPFAAPLALLACRRCSRPRRRSRPSGRELEDAVDGGVEEVAVVRDGQQRAGVGRPATPRATRGRRRRGGWWARRAAARSARRAGRPRAGSARPRRRRSRPSSEPRSRCSMPSRRRASSSRASSAQPPSASKRACASP